MRTNVLGDAKITVARRALLRHSLPIATLVFAQALSACSVPDAGKSRETEGGLAATRDELATYNGITFFTASNFAAPVCFYGGLPETRRIIRAAIETSWGAVTRLHFTGWNTCTSTASPMIPIRVVEHPTDANAWGGYAAIGVGARASGTPVAQIEIVTGANRSSLGPVAIHEMGHALGGKHEHQRMDTPGSCALATHTIPCATNTDCNSEPVNRICDFAVFGDIGKPGRCGNVDVNLESNITIRTPYDPQSVMLHAACRTGGNSLPTFWDIYGMQKIYGQRTTAIRQMVSSFSSDRTGFMTSVNPASGYALAYPEGWLFTGNTTGTVPLDLYFHSGRGDYMTLATSQSRSAAVAAGYTLVTTIGYVYPLQMAGTIPLKRYSRQVIQRNFTTSSPAGDQAALAGGYLFERIEGYVFAEVPYETLSVWFHTGRGDRLLTRTGSPLEAAAQQAGYVNSGFDGMTLKFALSGTTPLQQFWNGTREDHLETATPAGIQQAQLAGYVGGSNEGFVFQSPQTNAQEIRGYFATAIGDNATTTERGSPGSAYTFTRTEGYTYSTNW